MYNPAFCNTVILKIGKVTIQKVCPDHKFQLKWKYMHHFINNNTRFATTEIASYFTLKILYDF